MRDGADQQEEDEPEQDDQMDHRQQRGFNDGDGRHGALVEEAKKLMEDDDEAPAQNAGNEETGPKIKMGRIGKKKATKGGKDAGSAGAGSDNFTKKLTQAAAIEKSNGGSGFSEQDVEFMKKAIQVLCQSTNPLGKSIDYVTDDVDSMSKEFDHWRKEAVTCHQQLEEQHKITEELIQPLQD